MQKSIVGSYPLRTCSLITDDVQRLNSLAKACFSGLCRITSTGWNLLVQFVGTKTKHMQGWFSFIHVKKELLLCILQESINQTIFCELDSDNFAICFS
jgi:hypothetical protein